MTHLTVLHRVPISVWPHLILAVLCVPCLGVEAEVIGKATVTVDSAPIKDRDRVLATAKKGEVLDVVQVSGDWYQVNPTTGWVHRSQVRFGPVSRPGGDEAMVPAAPLGAREIAKRVSPSVVLLVMEDSNGQPLAMGSGFVIKDGIVATNLHVVEGASRGYAKLADWTDKFIVSGTVATDAAQDIVLLAVENLKAPALTLGDSKQVAVGDAVYAVGNPRGLEGTFSAGIISSIRKVGDDTLLQITAPISPGSSGGPVVNSKGEVIGIAVGTIEGGQNLNFVIPSVFLSALISQQGQVRPLGAARQSERTDDRIWNRLFEIFRKGAEGGNIDAMNNLGGMYDSGLGVAKDEREAVSWYRKAAEGGHTGAMFNLGVMYYTGRGVAKDERETVSWFRKAAEGGNTGAMYNLGVMYDAGRGVAKDEREAVSWYRKAAEGGHTGAMSNLGVMLYAEGRGVAKDEREAVSWFRKAAEGGNTNAMCGLGVMYGAGRGVVKDEREAVSWYRMAAEGGNATAMFHLGVMYEVKDEREAVSWYRKAAEGGHTGAMFNLGCMYASGRGVVKDDIEAYAWFSTASAFGQQAASKFRDHVEQRLTTQARLIAQERSRVLFEQISRRAKK
ncbi:MAG: trypsin-like peptidase domain-containing protein [Candidatus Hydrogenedentes bacterium]|nr:trypsin-like peptidase domain-containing protein [Candidatus Hydrogenedentota bacterium]